MNEDGEWWDIADGLISYTQDYDNKVNRSINLGVEDIIACDDVFLTAPSNEALKLVVEYATMYTCHVVCYVCKQPLDQPHKAGCKFKPINEALVNRVLSDI